MQFPTAALAVAPVPIEEPVGGVAVFLNLDDNVSGADRVDAAGGQEHRIACADRDRVELFLDGAVLERFFQLRARALVAQANVEFGGRRGLSDIPEFRLRLASELRRDMRRWVDLQ